MINQLQKENAERQAKILKWTIAAALFAAGALFVSCLWLAITQDDFTSHDDLLAARPRRRAIPRSQEGLGKPRGQA
jgi:hypothetical protein